MVVAEDGGFCLDDWGVCFGSSGVDIQEPIVGDCLKGLRGGERV